MISTLPGLRVRPFGGTSDLAAIVEVFNAESEADGIAERETVDGLGAWLGNPSEQFDPARDVVLAQLDGRVVAIAGQ